MFQLFNCIFTVLDTEIEAFSRFIPPPAIWLLLYVYVYVIFVFCSFVYLQGFKFQISGVLQIFCLNIAFTRKFGLKRGRM